MGGIHRFPLAGEYLFPGKKEASLILANLAKDLELYEMVLKDRRYSFSFDNGKHFDLEIAPNQLLHILGIKYLKFFSDEYAEFRDLLDLGDEVSSLQILKAIVTHTDEIINHDYLNIPVKLNYAKIRRKHELFNTFVNYDFNDFRFGMLEFSRQEFYRNANRRFAGEGRNLLFLRTDELKCPYIFLGLIQNSDDDYVVQTVVGPFDYEVFFQNQVVSLASSFSFSTPSTSSSYDAGYSEKLRELNQLKDMVVDFGIDFSYHYGNECIPVSSDNRGFEYLQKTMVKK